MTLAPRDPLAELSSALERLTTSLAGMHTADAMQAALRAADRLTAFATTLLARGGFSAASGMPPVTLLQVGARRAFTDAKALSDASGFLATMPLTRAAFDTGDLSWSEVRGIVGAVRVCSRAQRGVIDRVVGGLAGRGMQPDELLARVDHEVAALRADLERAREDDAISASFLAVQGRLDGRSSVHGELDAATTAALIAATDAAADRAVAADEDQPSRAQQRAQALAAVCEAYLSGGSADARPRPRLIATIDLDADVTAQRAQVLWGLAGRAPQLTPSSTQELLCDAQVIPVLTRGARPVAVGDARRTISGALRTALIARDGRCRFPGCRAPASWTDVHHIVPVSRGGTTSEPNCLLLCRRCHRLVHRFGWKIQIRSDGVIDFSRRGRSYASRPAAHLRA